MGLLTAANAAGQLIFLPLLAMLAQRYGWRGVSATVTLVVLGMFPIVAMLLPEWPADVALGPYSEALSRHQPASRDNPFALAMAVLFAPPGPSISGSWP